MESQVSVQLTVRNNSDRPLTLWWVNTEGLEVPYDTVRPHTPLERQTYVTHRWHFRQDGRIVGAYVANDSASQTFITSPNGRNAGWIDFSNASETVEGTFVQMDGTRWEERQPGRVTHRFEQTGRDEWSVYLRDASRDVELQLDLYKREVNVEPYGPGRRTIYQVRGARVNAYATGIVGYRAPKGEAGEFLLEQGQWIRYPDGGKPSTYEETGRDVWSIYLRDSAGGTGCSSTSTRAWSTWARGSRRSPESWTPGRAAGVAPPSEMVGG